jgi:hypothetical protein
MPGFPRECKTCDNRSDYPETPQKWREKDPQDLGAFSFEAYFDTFFLRIAKERALAAFR